MASKLLIFTVLIFDVIAFALAVVAERRRSTAIIFEDKAAKSSYCVYESDISTGLGVGSFFFLLASQILIMIASRCFCCGKPLSPGGSRAWAIVLFIICWVFFLIAEICLFAGSVKNAYHTKYRTLINTQTPLSCETLRRGVFAAGAAFIFFNTIVSEFYYISYARARDSFHGLDTGVGMGVYKFPS